MKRTGLLRPKYDRRDYLHPTYGATVPTTFPDEYNCDAGLWNPNQNNTNAPTGINIIPPLPYGCTDYSQADLYNDHTKVLHSPELLEDITHANARGGIDIRESLNAARKLGWFDNYSQPRSVGAVDMFDAVRLAMISEKDGNWGISVGSPFFPQWLDESVLSIPQDLKAYSGWHNWDIKGWTTVNGVLYLRCKMWTGDWKLMSRETFNLIMGIRFSCAFIPSNNPHTGDTINFDVVAWIVSKIKSLFGV